LSTKQISFLQPAFMANRREFVIHLFIFESKLTTP
jgi:hypothetical protein